MKLARQLLGVVVVGAVALACADGDTSPSSATDVSTTASPTASVTTPPATTPEPTTTRATETTTTLAAETTTAAAASTSTTAAVPYPTTTVHQVPDDCDVAGMFAIVDDALAEGRLAPGGEWSTDTEGVTFDERTNEAEEFRHRMGLDCMVRAAQVTDSGDERLLLAAWTGHRNAYVVQATDGPESPYAAEQLFELFIEQPFGEWLTYRFAWVGTLNDGATVVVGTDDTAIAIAAKSWLAAVPRFEDLPVTVAVEQYGIDLLLQAGARNVSVAEPAAYGSELSALQMITPLGLHLVPTIAGSGWFDPTIELFEGVQTTESYRGVEIYVATGAPDAYAIASVGWECDDHVWYFDSLYGTVEELVDWAHTLIDTAACDG